MLDTTDNDTYTYYRTTRYGFRRYSDGFRTTESRGVFQVRAGAPRSPTRVEQIVILTAAVDFLEIIIL